MRKLLLIPLMLATSASAELDAVDEVHGESSLAISYQVSKDFNMCVRGIPELAAHDADMYRGEYAGCCNALWYGAAYAKDTVPAECSATPNADGTFPPCSPGPEPAISGTHALMCGDNLDSRAETLRTRVLEAIRNRENRRAAEASADWDALKAEFVAYREEAE